MKSKSSVVNETHTFPSFFLSVMTWKVTRDVDLLAHMTRK